MTEEPRTGGDSWPLLASCVGLVLMGVFIITSTSDPLAGWLFVVFGSVVIAVTGIRAAIAAVRNRRG